MKILILANYGMGLYQFRRELIINLINNNNKVYVSLPFDEYTPKLEELGCKFINTMIERHGTNPLTDFQLFLFYRKILKKISPDVVLTYTIKPNIYGSFACRLTKTPYLNNITGLGKAVENAGLLQKLTLLMYRIAVKKSFCIFFQNKENQDYFIKNNIISGNHRLIPGSGVNIDNHCLEEYPVDTDQIKFIFLGRIMREKGMDELLITARMIKKKYFNVSFDIVGKANKSYEDELMKLEKEGIINFHGTQFDVHSFIKNCHAIINPSYHEGMSNVLLEAASTGRPVLASDIPGCRETFDDGISGMDFEVKNADSLYKTLIKFIELPYEKKRQMGIEGRKKMEREFNRNIVIDAYMEEIKKFEGDAKK